MVLLRGEVQTARRADVVIGTSGLTAADFGEIDSAARERTVGVVASGNFSLTAAMCQAAALLAARHLPQWEVVDYASATKPDVPSGTARELAERLGEVRRPEIGRPIDQILGPREARGADVAGTQERSVNEAHHLSPYHAARDHKAAPRGQAISKRGAA